MKHSAKMHLELDAQKKVSPSEQTCCLVKGFFAAKAAGEPITNVEGTRASLYNNFSRASSVSARDLKRCAKRFGKLAHASKSRTIQLTSKVVDARTLRRIH